MLWKLIQAGAIVVFLAGPASAQAPGIPINPKRPPTQEEIERQRAADQEYNAAIQKMPDKKSNTDPWGSIRPGSPTASKNKQ